MTNKLHIYNTLTRQKEQFQPIDENDIRIYSCGPTVYSDPHLGNLRYFFFCGLLGDVLRMIYGSEHVTQVMNITDVGHLTDDGDAGEDKMEKWARREGVSAWDIAKKYEDNFKRYIEQLHIHFDKLPKATDHIEEQIAIVKMLEEKWYTYEIDQDGIYMNTSKIADYGKLMWPNYAKHIEGLQAGARVDVEGKKNATDFALWKFSPEWQQRQMEWESPRWKGFPGWHIECNAMSRKYLGDHFDIHTGGVDHIPVHHSDEIAQAECSYAEDKPWVNYWMHAQFLNIGGEKVAKSAGDDLSLPAIIAKWYTPEDLRYFFLQAHYRSFQDFSWEALAAAKKGRQKLQIISPGDEVELLEQFREDLLDDLNTPALLAKLHKFGVPKWLDDTIRKLGIGQDKIEEIIIPEEIKALAEKRWEAKQAKDYAMADELRDELKAAGREMREGKDNYSVVPLEK